MRKVRFGGGARAWWLASGAAMLFTGGTLLAQGFAFGIDRLSGDFVRFELDEPEIMTVLGPSGATSVVNACEFDAGGAYAALYCVDTGNPASYFSLDTRTGARTNLGTIPLGSMTFVVALATDPTTEVIYAVLCTTSFVSSLHTLDFTTGGLTLVATISGAGCIAAAGFDSSGELFGIDGVADTLVAIDKVTGGATTLGPIGFDQTFPPAIDFVDDACFLFAFNGGSGIGELRTCDTTTGGTTLIGAFGSDVPGGFGAVAAAGIDPRGLFADGFEAGDSARWSGRVTVR
jgi:hypothetical protein